MISVVVEENKQINSKQFKEKYPYTIKNSSYKLDQCIQVENPSNIEEALIISSKDKNQPHQKFFIQQVDRGFKLFPCYNQYTVFSVSPQRSFQALGVQRLRPDEPVITGGEYNVWEINRVEGSYYTFSIQNYSMCFVSSSIIDGKQVAIEITKNPQKWFIE